MIYLYFVSIALSFVFMFKCADWFVEGASAIATILHIPKMVIGIVLVGLATTAPEFAVSVIAAFLGNPEIALGNAVGSVICDDGVALALAAFLAPVAIFVNCRIVKIAGTFLLSIDILAYLMARNGTIGRIEGITLIFILCIYYVFIIRNRNVSFGEQASIEQNSDDDKEASVSRKTLLKRPLFLFTVGIIGVVITSRVIVWAAVNIAKHFDISEIIIGSTIVAMGTSLPEISTCITAALKGEGEIAVGDIIGADILNILWIIGMASLVRPITVELDIINFAFPYMILIVAVMLLSMRVGCRLGKAKGILLLVLYIIYLFLTLKIFI